MARLILSTAEGQQAIELRPVNSLGRHPNNSIQLLDKIVSKEHCIVELRGDHYVLRDLGSLNGTFVNNERVRGEQGLKHGDEIALGATRGRFDDGTGPPLSLSPSLPPGPAAVQQPQMPARPGQSGWQPVGAGPSSAVAAGSNYPSAAAAGSSYPGAAGAGASPLAQSVQQVRGIGPAPQSSAPSTQQPSGGYAPAPHAATPAYVPPLPAGPGGTAPLAMAARQTGPNATSYMAQGARVDLNDQARQIGTQIAAVEKGFLPFDRIANDPAQLRADYERLRLSHELSRAIGLERDTTRLLSKILESVFKFIRADRGVIFLRDDSGELTPRASQRRDGTNAPITVSTTILSHVVKERAAVLTHDAAMDFAASKGKSMILNRISSAIVAPLLHDNEVLGVLWLDSETLAQFQPKDLELVSSVANQAAMFIEINILGKKIELEIVNRERFSRLLSPNIAERVLSGQLEVKQGGQRVDNCTVFNSDIRGFTRMSEGSSPEVLVEMLNEYFELMVDTVFKYEGTLDKFMGDGIMALWGAPVAHPDDAVRSVQCALEMAEVLATFNRARLAKEQAPLAVGVGIHSGPLVAGYIGSSKALSYTVVGDVANTSARLCAVALAGQIIISETTLERLGEKFECQELAPARVKGKEKPLRIFNVLRSRLSAQVPAQIFGSEHTSTTGDG